MSSHQGIYKETAPVPRPDRLAPAEPAEARVAINGFGRIGRGLCRLLAEHPHLRIGLINDPMPTDQAAYLLKYDSVHGRFPLKVETGPGGLWIGDTLVRMVHEESMAGFNWEANGVELVVNSSGKRNERDHLESFLENDARRVLISAPAPDVADVHILRGVNDDALRPEHRIISGGSCTAHCFAPAVMELTGRVGIERGFLQTIHSYTSSQNLMDGPHASDPRRGRNAASNIVPTTTEAVKAFEQALPQFRGLLKGMAMRVPVTDGSNIDLVLQFDRECRREDVNRWLREGADGRWRGIMEYSEDPLVSSDIVGNPHSCVVDSLLTEVHGNLARVFLWYDNEWGYTKRFVELLELCAR